jgi:L-fuconolactonase
MTDTGGERIDSHIHFWRIARGDYHWMTPEMSIRRDYDADDLRPLLQAAGVDRIVLVQAAATVAETEFLLGLAQETPFVAGVVGWVDMAAGDAVETLERLSADPHFKGIRPMIHDIPDVDWMLRSDLIEAFRAVMRLGLSFDLLVRPPHLKNSLTLLSRFPDLRAIIDHGAKPEIAEGRFDAWAEDMRRLARETNAWCKMSGLITEASPDWSVDDLRPYVDHLIEQFGPGRLIWGSDWPVLTLAASYADWADATDQLLAGLPTADRARIRGGNALEAYRL